MIQNAYSKSPTRHLITYQTTWSHRSLIKLIIINHHSTRNTWEHIASTPIWTYFSAQDYTIAIRKSSFEYNHGTVVENKSATRMYILRRYHLPAAARCLMKNLISGPEFLHGDDTRPEMQMELHIEFDSDSNAESCVISTKMWTYLLRNRTPYSKKTEGANFEKPPAFKGGNRKST